MSEFTPLREAVDELANRALPPGFGDLKGRATRRGRRRMVMVAAAAAAVMAGSVLAITDFDGERQAAPAKQPKPSLKAGQIIADGRIYGYDAHGSGAVLTVFTTCHGDDTDCGDAWRLGTSARPLATGVLPAGGEVAVHASEEGFVLSHPIGDAVSLRVGLDGTVTALARCRDHNPPVEPERLVWDWTFALDRAGVFCPTRFGGGDFDDDGIEARPLAGSGGFTADGTLWAMVSNEGSPTTQTLGKFDGSRWHYRDLAPEGEAYDSVIAAAGTNVVILSRSGLSVTTDDGATWHEVTDPAVLERDLPFLAYAPADGCCTISMAFAGSSTLYVADARGGMWRSTDLTTFHQIEAPGAVQGLKSAGDDVLGLDKDTNGLVRIAADGRVEVLTVR